MLKSRDPSGSRPTRHSCHPEPSLRTNAHRKLMRHAPCLYQLMWLICNANQQAPVKAIHRGGAHAGRCFKGDGVPRCAVYGALQQTAKSLVMNAPVIRHEQRQHQTLTPRLQQAVRLLQLSSLDFAQEVNQAMGNNPFLELDEAPEGESTARDRRQRRRFAARGSVGSADQR